MGVRAFKDELRSSAASLPATEDPSIHLVGSCNWSSLYDMSVWTQYTVKDNEMSHTLHEEIVEASCYLVGVVEINENLLRQMPTRDVPSHIIGNYDLDCENRWILNKESPRSRTHRLKTSSCM